MLNPAALSTLNHIEANLAENHTGAVVPNFYHEDGLYIFQVQLPAKDSPYGFCLSDKLAIVDILARIAFSIRIDSRPKSHAGRKGRAGLKRNLHLDSTIMK